MSGPTARSSLHEALRGGTADAHRDLERHIETAGLLDSLAGYGHWLRGWWQLQDLLEAALEDAGVQRLLPDWPRRRRAELIARDLARLGISRSSAPVPAPPLGGPEEVLGTCYVLEGASLGTRVLGPRIRALGEPARVAMGFVDAAGQAHRPSWRAFLDVLAAWSGRVDVTRTVVAAERCFGLAGELLLSGTPIVASPPRRNS